MKTKQKSRRLRGDSMTKEILDFLLDFVEMLPKPFESPYAHMRRMHRLALGIPEPKKWQYNKTLGKLVKSQKVEVSEKDGRLFIKLTKKGKLAALLLKLDRGLNKSKRWDGKWRLIIWDIPESSRKERNAIRWFLKSLGFFRLQKSVFITPYELPTTAVYYLKESGFIKFIRFLRVDKIDSDKLLKKHFDLK